MLVHLVCDVIRSVSLVTTRFIQWGYFLHVCMVRRRFAMFNKRKTVAVHICVEYARDELLGLLNENIWRFDCVTVTCLEY